MTDQNALLPPAADYQHTLERIAHSCQQGQRRARQVIRTDILGTYLVYMRQFYLKYPIGGTLSHHLS